MKKLDVTRYTQKVNSGDCGPVVARTILDYFGVKKTTKELAEELRYGNFGTYISDNGLLFLKHGLTATLVTANTILFDYEDRKSLKTKILAVHYLKKLLTRNLRKMRQFKNGIRIMLEFLEHGGNIKIEIPSLRHIKGAIDRGDLVMALVVPNAFSVGNSFHHFVAVNGYDDRYIYIADPWPTSTAHKVRNEDFLYGIHASTVGDLDTGSLLIVGKRRHHAGGA